jgi:trk system potassium uptake protein TrkA
VKIVIVGCGRVGASLAESYDRAGHEVVILDSATSAFERLPSSFRGESIRGDGTDEDVLRRAGAEGADVFLALTEGDNRNVMAAQLANEALAVKRVIAKINDPVRATAYAELGIATLCRTGLMMDAIDGYLGLPSAGLPGMLAPTGHHGGDHGRHHTLPGAETSTAGGGSAAGAAAGGGSAAGPAGALGAAVGGDSSSRFAGAAGADPSTVPDPQAPSQTWPAASQEV